MVRDLRGKEISEGDVIVFTPEVKLTDAIVVDVSAPMVQQAPNGQQGMFQRVSALIQFNFVLPANGALPVAVIDKAGDENAVKALEMLRSLVAKVKSGSTGGSLINTEK